MVRMKAEDERALAESFWLRDAKVALLQRDPVDALNDAEALVRFAQGRLDQILPSDAKT